MRLLAWIMALCGLVSLLRDGVLIELGKVALRFRDPADRQLAAPSSTVVASPSAARKVPAPAAPAPTVPPQTPSATATPTTPRASTAPFYAAVVILAAALVGLVWVLSLA
jgi:hypothetical protein